MNITMLTHAPAGFCRLLWLQQRVYFLQDGASALAEVSLLGAEAGSTNSQDAVPASPDVTACFTIPGPPAEPEAAHPAPAMPAAAGSHGPAAPAAERPALDAAADATCVMCLDVPKDVILAPCGHQCLCRQAEISHPGTACMHRWLSHWHCLYTSLRHTSRLRLQLLAHAHCVIGVAPFCRGCTLILMSSPTPAARCCPVCRTKVGVLLRVPVRSWKMPVRTASLKCVCKLFCTLRTVSMCDGLPAPPCRSTATWHKSTGRKGRGSRQRRWQHKCISTSSCGDTSLVCVPSTLCLATCAPRRCLQGRMLP